MSHAAIDISVRNILELFQEVAKLESPYDPEAANTEANRCLIRQVAADKMLHLLTKLNRWLTMG